MVNGKIKNLVHPNRLTAYGLGLCAAGVGLVAGGESTDVVGLGLIVAGDMLDLVDGHVARKLDMQTVEGARMDPLADKFKHLMKGSYALGREAARMNLFLPIAVLVSFGVDALNQMQRGKMYGQVREFCKSTYDPDSCSRDVEVESSVRANRWGKTKTAIYNSFGYIYFGKEVIENHYGAFSEAVKDNISFGLSAVLLTGVTLGVAGFLKRSRGKREIL